MEVLLSVFIGKLSERFFMMSVAHINPISAIKSIKNEDIFSWKNVHAVSRGRIQRRRTVGGYLGEF